MPPVKLYFSWWASCSSSWFNLHREGVQGRVQQDLAPVGLGECEGSGGQQGRCQHSPLPGVVGTAAALLQLLLQAVHIALQR